MCRTLFCLSLNDIEINLVIDWNGLSCMKLLRLTYKANIRFMGKLIVNRVHAVHVLLLQLIELR